jgi:phosphonate transport system substrate-binding protein
MKAKQMLHLSPPIDSITLLTGVWWKKADFNYLWWSATIPQDPFAYRMSLCPELREKIQQTFLTLHQVPEAKAWLDNVKSNKCVPMTDSDYDVIRILKKAKEEKKKKQ